jgi:Right handed beta helix region
VQITRTTAIAPQTGIRIGLCSEKDSLLRNIIFNNTGTNFKAGVWLDRSSIIGQPGLISKNNSDKLIQENQIYSNNGSGVVLSTNSTGACYNTRISKNSIYYNTGMGIDLNFSGTAGPTLVTTNDEETPTEVQHSME